VLHGPAGPALIGACLLLTGLVAVLVRRWARATGWNDLRLLALTAGALLGHTLAWAPLQAASTRLGVTVLFGLSAALLVVLARAVRRRGEPDTGAAPEPPRRAASGQNMTS
jgi:uncharacterized membrane protein HdeD (DUF308 family)